jgi:serine/threonine-protein kinase
MMTDQSPRGRLVGRYVVHDRIAAGGMATVHLGRLIGAAGFSRTVAIKRLHDTFTADPGFVAMLLDEARLVAHIRHPNVVPTLDVVAEGTELLVVMEYVEGDSVSQLVRETEEKGERIPPAFAASIVAQALHGLHAAHEAKDRDGRPLGIVHRDVSPQNILVGVDGVARVLDFGIAKAASRATTTEDGQLKGKAAYMAPEHLGRGSIDRRTDVFAASVVLWELLTGRRLFAADSPAEVMARVQSMPIDSPLAYAPDLPPELALVVLRGLERDPEGRFQTAEEMAVAIEEAIAMPRPKDLGAWVAKVAAETLAERAELAKEVERSSHRLEAAAQADGSLREAIEAAERRRMTAELPTDIGAAVAKRPPSVTPPPAFREEATPAPLRPAPPSRAPLVAGIAIAAFGVVALLLAFFVVRGSRGDARAELPDSGSTSLGAPPAIDAAVVTPPPPPIVSVAPSASTKPPKGVRGVKGGTSKPAVDPCQVPFVVDANGNKHFKEECVK